MPVMCHTRSPFSTGPTGKSASDDLYFGISASTFPEEVNKILMSPLKPQDVEIKPDGKNGNSTSIMLHHKLV